MLSADQSALFLDCSVFAGWFDSADAAAVSAAVRTEPTVMSLSWLAECSLLQSTTGDGTTRYRMLATVRSVAQARLAAEGGTASVAQRHADWVLGRLRWFDSALRSSPEPVQRSVLDGLVDEARVVNRWAQATDPALGSEVCGLLHLPAYTGLWHEPADWGRRLMEAGVDAPGTRVAIAGLETHRGNLGRAKALLEGDAATATGRERVNALEVLSDAALYGGDLDVALELAALMSDEGTRHSDQYAVAMGTVFTALARAYGGRVDEALEALERARPFSLAPAAARGWLHYTLGEVLALQSRFGAASDELQHAVAHGSRIEHRYLVSVARATLATVLGRSGDSNGAFAAMGECLRDCRRNGNMVHAVTAMRNLVDLLVKSGRDSEAVVVWAGAATADWGGSYGSESETVRDAVSKAGARLGMSTFEQCRREGEQLGVHGALDRAIDVIARLLP
jgi:tetratricopeptide (TPR) repeat protein